MITYNLLIMEQNHTPELRLVINNARPIELTDLTASLTALGEEFKSFIESTHPEISAADVSLYIHEIRKGSIIADLLPWTPALLGFAGNINTTIEFITHVKSGVELLLSSGNGDISSDVIKKQTASNLSALVEPIAKDSKSTLIIESIGEKASVVININHQEANALQNTAKRHIQSLKDSVHGLKENVVMHWFQARKAGSSGAGDKAIIESISPKPVRTKCNPEILKAQMVMSATNPFQEAFLVDAVVQTVNGKPAFYQIIKLHERLEL